MQYTAGNIKRVFMVRFDHEDDLLDALLKLVKSENIRAGWFQLIGGVGNAEIVTGPVRPTVPPVPVWHQLDKPTEIIAAGSIAWCEGEPLLHVHGAAGNSEIVKVGCLRKQLEVYLLIEAVIFEFEEMSVCRKWFDSGQFNRLEIA